MGNLEFESAAGGTGDGSQVNSKAQDSLNAASAALSVPPADLQKGFCVSTITSKALGSIAKDNNVKQAESCRDSFAQKLYGLLFNYLVN